jgi:hypothetical protein
MQRHGEHDNIRIKVASNVLNSGANADKLAHPVFIFQTQGETVASVSCGVANKHPEDMLGERGAPRGD